MSHESHAFTSFNARQREGLVVASRRNFLKASLAGLAGLSVPQLLRSQERAANQGQLTRTGKSVILLWMAGGPSHIDTWDMKPDRPLENRGPFAPVATRLPGVRICEYLPKQAAMLDKFTIIRSMDATHSNHEPNMVMQTANLDAAPRVSRVGHLYPAIGSIVAKHHGPNHPSMPAYAAFMRSRSHLAFAGYLGRQYDPFMAQQAATLPVYDLVGNDTGTVSSPTLFRMAEGIDINRIEERRALQQSFDGIRRDLDTTGSMVAMDRYGQQAVEMIAGRRAQSAFDITREPAAVRDRYGKHLWCQQTLLARRLVEAGVAFVTLDLSYHTASGTWDTHGDNIPPYGGIWNGLRPLLPLFDHLVTTLVSDLDQRGMLDDVLVIAMGEFGRTPQMGTQDSTDGRNHWPVVMSLCLAGGGMRHGQVIGATEADGGSIKERRVTPGDLAATIYQHMGVPLDTQYLEPSGRPRNVIDAGGTPIRELLG
ncbi:MAG TPA: DUF1501 domain-containing protein [Gemmataceae bacterium]|nr:DUF1501 domain-containing protein [Gemmataceae bacterium]